MINWAGYLPAAVIVSLIPGANQLLGLNNAVRYGPLAALVGIAGRLAAFVLLIGAVVAGLGAVLAASTTALEVIRWAGVGYLAWLGFTSLSRARHPDPQPRTHSLTALVREPGGEPLRLATREFLVAITNPKALLLFAALLPQFAGRPGPETGLHIAVLGAVYLVVELVVGSGYIVVGSGIGAVGLSPRTMRRVDTGSGVVFLGLAVLLGIDSVAARR